MQESLGEAYPGHIRYEHDALNSAFGSPAQHVFLINVFLETVLPPHLYVTHLQGADMLIW